MKLLAIETSGEACSVALSLNDTLLERFELAPRGHAERLLPWVSELLDEAGMALSALDAIAFSRGPGNFTSLRIGIGVVQGLAWGADRPVIPVSSLQTIAQAAVERGVERALVAVDARMQEVFTGRYVKDAAGLMQPAGEERVCAPGVLAAEELSPWAGVGNAFERFPELQAGAARLQTVLADIQPRAATVCRLARHWADNHEPLSAGQAQPVYIRNQVAVKPGD